LQLRAGWIPATLNKSLAHNFGKIKKLDTHPFAITRQLWLELEG